MKTLDRGIPTLGGLVLATLVVGAVSCVLGPVSTRAQEGQEPTRRTRALQERLESREALQQLYRELYEVQIALRGHRDPGAARDSLVRLRKELIADIEAVHSDLEARPLDPPDAPRPPGLVDPGEVDVLVRELEQLGEGIDLSEIGKLFEKNAHNWGEGLSAIGEQLQGLRVDVEGSRVKIETDTGSRVTWRIPDEMKESLSEGIREVGEELNRVLSDSSSSGFGRDLRELLEDLPADIPNGIFGRERPRHRKVIAQSIFRFFEDVEIADDEMVEGDVIVIGSDAYVAGEIQGNCYMLFGDLFVEQEGTVGKDAVSLGGRVTLDDDSVVHGRMFDMGSIVPGLGFGSWSGSDGFAWMMHWVRVAVLALLLLLAYAAFGHRLRPMATHGLQFPGRDLASGTLWFAIVLGGVVISSVGLAITVIGIPVVVVVLAAFTVAMMLAYFVGCQLVGTRLLAVVGGPGAAHPGRTALVGLAILEIPALLALGFHAADGLSSASTLLQALDLVVKFLVLFVGFGALVATRVGGRASAPAPAETLPSSFLS